MIKGKRIVVTGGAGFIGSNIAGTLCKSNKVMIIDNMHSGSTDNVNELAKNGVLFFMGNSGEIAAAAESFDPDIIFHLGIYSSTPMYRNDHGLVASVINDATNLFAFASERKIPVVFASSSSIYNGHRPPHHEELVPKVTDYYTEARIAVERLAQLNSDMQGLNAIALRLFAVYGPHDEKKGSWGNLITQFMLSMMKGESPIVYGDGLQTRDFTYIEDVVDAFTRAQSLKGFNIINVGRGESFTVNEMIEKLNRHLGTSLNATYIRNPLKNYVEHTGADTRKAKQILGFTAKYSLDEGMAKLYEYLARHESDASKVTSVADKNAPNGESTVAQ